MERRDKEKVKEENHVRQRTVRVKVQRQDRMRYLRRTERKSEGLELGGREEQ